MQNIDTHLSKCGFKSEKQPLWLRMYLKQKESEFQKEDDDLDLMSDDGLRDQQVIEKVQPLALRLFKSGCEGEDEPENKDPNISSLNKILGKVLGGQEQVENSQTLKN